MSDAAYIKILNELAELQQKYGSDFLLTLCAVVISECCWWNWDQLKNGIVNDAEAKQLLNNKS